VLDLRHSMTSLDRKLASAVAYLAGIERANNARLSGLDGLLNSCTLGMHERTYRRVLYHGDNLPCQGEKARLTLEGKEVEGPSSGRRLSSTAMSSVYLPSSCNPLGRKRSRGLLLLNMERLEMRGFQDHWSRSVNLCMIGIDVCSFGARKPWSLRCCGRGWRRPKTLRKEAP
jgi:hypothetical protein